MSALISELLIAKLKKCKDLPSPPGVASQIITLSAKPNSDLDTLAELVSMDPALSTKILRMANSSLYMRRVEAESIQQAVMMFGWTGTLNIALSFSVVGSINQNGANGLDYNFFWNRSLAAAVAARRLAEIRRYPNKDELFLPALLQDIGMLALDRAIPDLYTDIGKTQQNHKQLCDFETEELSSDHSAIGSWLLHRWKIPEKICRLVEFSHTSEDYSAIEGVDALPLECISTSGLFADCICCDEKNKDYTRTADVAEKLFDIDITEFLTLIGKITEEFQEMAQLFDMDVGDTEKLETTAEQAKKVLLRDAYGVLT